MPVPWNKRKDRVKLWEQRNKEEGLLPYWNDRARSINYKAKKRYYCTETVTGQELKDLYELSGGICFYCKQPVSPSEAHFDHMEPLNSGGRNDIHNGCISCMECNTSKGDDSIDNFLNRVFETQTPERIYNSLFTVKGVINA